MDYVKLSARAYKAFGGTISLPLVPLTVVFGSNGSGKSALCRLPIALHSAFCAGRGRAPGLPLNVDGLSFGESAGSFRHGTSSPNYMVSLDIKKDGGIYRFEAIIGLDISISASTPSQRVERFRLFINEICEEDIRWSSSDRKYKIDDEAIDNLKFSGLLPTGPRTERIQRLQEQFPSVQRLAASRNGTKHALGKYQYSNMLSTGANGELSSDVLGTLYAERDDDTIDLIKKHTKNVLGIEISISNAGHESLSRYAIWGEREEHGFKVTTGRLGTGVAHALPVIVQHAIAIQRTPSPGLLITEEPEAHLHPRAQAALADIFVETAKAGKTKCLVETHSETFILRIRRRVAEGGLDPSSVRFVWIDEDDPETTLRICGVERDGELVNSPDNWFSAGEDEVEAIHSARRAR